MDIIINILIGVVGIIFFIAWNSRQHIKSNSFSLKVHFKQNWKRWSWSVVMLSLIAIIVGFEPKIADAIKTFTGLDITNERGAFFSTGLALAGLIKGVVKKN